MRLASQLSQGTCQLASTGTRHCLLTRFHCLSSYVTEHPERTGSDYSCLTFCMTGILVCMMLNVTIHYNSDFDKRFLARLSKIYVLPLHFISQTPHAIESRPGHVMPCHDMSGNHHCTHSC